MYRTILVPLDGSILSERALPYARSLARANGARLVLLRAVEPASISESLLPRDRDKAIADAEAYLAGLFPGPNDASPVTTLVSPGNAGELILEEVRSRDVDLIVMSTHGRSGLSRTIYGSVAERVCHQAPVPVLLVPSACEHAWTSDRPPRILVPLDGSTLAEAALGHVEELAEALGAEMIALRVAEPPEYVRFAYPDIPEGEVFEVGDVRQAGDYLEAIASRLRARGGHVAARVESGAPAATILAVAREENADVIAMATHGRGGLARLMMGSVATGVVQRSNRPVFLVRSGLVPHRETDESARSTDAPIAATLGALGLQEIVQSASRGNHRAARDVLAALNGPDFGIQTLVEQELDQVTNPLLWTRLIEFLALGSWDGQLIDLPVPVSTDGDYLKHRIQRVLLPRLGAPAEDAKRQALRRSLDESRQEIQIVALELVGLRGERSLTDGVIAALAGESLEVKEQAATVLGRLGGSAAIEALVRALHTQHGILGHSITAALVQIGPDAVPRLIDELDQPDDTARWHVTEALADLTDPRAVDPLVHAIEDPDLAVRWNAARGLARLGKPALEAMLRALATRPLTPSLAQGAQYILRHTGLSHRSQRLPAVVAALGHPSASVEVPVRAAEALAEIESVRAPI